MERIRIQNLRALQDTDYVELKPLTILVGKNSSGKSTFLRFFPLMKQTLETRTNEPILWYSPTFVDFGSFNESLNYKNKGESISFEFKLKLAKKRIYEGAFFLFKNRYSQKKIIESETDEDENVNLDLKIIFSEKIINKIEVKLWDHEIEFFYQKEGVKISINGEYLKEKLVSGLFGNSTNMLQNFVIEKEKKFVLIGEYFRDKVFRLVNGNDPSSTEESLIVELINSINLGDSHTILRSLKEIDYKSKSIEKQIDELEINHPVFIEIKNSYFGIFLNEIVDICNEELKSFFLSVNYIAPIRASAERYYRIQGLALNEIDPQGVNIPMFLNNMSNAHKKKFNNWIKDNFHFDIVAESTGGHTSLFIRYENGTKINLADTGFGYSQILPIILVLWQAVQTSEKIASYKEVKLVGRNRNFTIAIEQPELHLHPSLQAVLIDTFAKIIKVSKEIGIDLKIIIETHSETMINRVGQLIATKYEDFNKDLVNVLIFNSSDPFISNIRSTGYTEDGYLTSWPIGFFSPEDR
ncbi:AAA family ATPase [Bacillus altitudinis]|uniref:AAA family ATPase n=1 Tax=Bacillus altitudinis TaxID=293387 RepID=UPI002DBCF2F7|nr:AAA family ATPase [Bacillus altitudinis]MEC1012152.1 AAA family ATPase [Bacillus altitudinis]